MNLCCLESAIQELVKKGFFKKAKIESGILKYQLSDCGYRIIGESTILEEISYEE